VDADAIELRVLGCLIEKNRTTPDAYPLSLNSLQLAANQSTNRDPVVDYDEPTIRSALERLSRRGWVRLASGAGSRAIKYRHLFDEALGLAGAETSLLCVLMLRGEQTPGELKQRAERLHRFVSLEEVERKLNELVERGLVERLPRRPGQKEERYRQLLGDGDGTPPASEADMFGGQPPGRVVSGHVAGSGTGLEERVARLEEEVAELREALESLRRET
jgi:uncharacterized protein YceH (UPF0502 family)